MSNTSCRRLAPARQLPSNVPRCSYRIDRTAQRNDDDILFVTSIVGEVTAGEASGVSPPRHCWLWRRAHALKGNRQNLHEGSTTGRSPDEQPCSPGQRARQLMVAPGRVVDAVASSACKERLKAAELTKQPGTVE